MESGENNGEPLECAKDSERAAFTEAVDTASLLDMSETASKDEDRSFANIGDVRVSTDGDKTVLNADRAEEEEDEENHTITGPSGVAFSCSCCDESYTTEERLRHHLKDGDVGCSKEHAARGYDKIKYGCSRCHGQMGKKYSTERHIKDSCWKVCDECCEAGVPKCDAHYTDGDCTPCEGQGLSCTKHTGPVLDSNAEPQTGPVHLPQTKPSRAVAPSGPQRTKRKRKAIASPEASSEPKPVTKRQETMVNQEQAAQDQGKEEKLRAWKQTLEKPELFQPITMPRQPLREYFSQAHPPDAAYMSSFNPQEIRPGAQYDGTGRPAPLSFRFPYVQRQQEGHRGLTTALDSSLRYTTSELGLDKNASNGFSANAFGTVPNRGTYDMRLLNPSAVNQTSSRNFQAMQQATLGQQLTSSHHLPARRGTTPVSRYIHRPQIRNLPATRSPTPVQKPDRMDFKDTHNLDSRLERFRPALSAITKIHEDSPSQVSRVPFLASAPGSRMPSRETTAEPMEDNRAFSRMPPFEQLRGMNRMPPTVAKEHISADTTQPVSLQGTASPTSAENGAVIRFKLHTNTYDASGTAMFSILTMRAFEKFGPRLDAYCQHRNKEYGKDWVLALRYVIRNQDDAKDSIKERYILITYDMTPNDVQNGEVQLPDLDTIVVMKAKSPLSAMDENERNGRETAKSSLPGSQLLHEDVDIIDGETPVYPDAGVVDEYYNMYEQAMHHLRSQKTHLESIIHQQQVKLKQQEATIKTLETCNTQLIQNNLRIRHASRTLHTPRRQPQPAHRNFIPGMGFRPGSTVITRPGPVAPPAKPSAFMARLEAAREPVQRTMPHKTMQPFRFPMQEGCMPQEAVLRQSSRERMQQFRFPMAGQDSLSTVANDGGLAFAGGDDVWGVEGGKGDVGDGEGEEADGGERMEEN